MTAPNNERQLLFALLAFQNNFIDRAALLAGFDIWSQDKALPISEALVRNGKLSNDERLLLEGLVEKHLARFQGDVFASLAHISAVDSSVRDELKHRTAGSLEASLAIVGKDVDPFATAPMVGENSSEGARFRILRPHARGGLGEVFVAVDGELDREVALKRIQDRHADDAESRARFLQEAEITGKLEHPSIVPVYGLGTYDNGRPFYAMRFIRGDSLQDAVRRHYASTSATAADSSVEFRKLLQRFIDVCNAVEYAHSRGVLHRDLKPGNIMLGKYGETLVVDWGLAKATGAKSSNVDRVADEGVVRTVIGDSSAETAYGSAVGTPGYMSPEQALGKLDSLGPQSDVYGLGATLYYVLTGKPPFEGTDLGEVLRHVQAGEFRPPRRINPQLPRPLEAICLRAMALQSDRRYPSAGALADDMERWLADERVEAHHESLGERTGRWTRTHRTTVAAVAALTATALIALVVGLFAVSAEQRETDRQRQAAETAHQLADAARQAAETARKGETEKLRALRRETAKLAFQQGTMDWDAGGGFNGMRQLVRAFQLADTDDPLRVSYLRVLLDRTHIEDSVLLRHADVVNSASFSPDGTRVVTASADKTARVWDALTGEPLGDPLRHDGDVASASFSSDSIRVVTASWDKTARIWNAKTGTPIGAPLRHGTGVIAASFSPDGTRIVTVSADTTAILWDATTGEPIGEGFRHGMRVSAASFSPDGTRVVTSAINTVRLWDATTCKQIGETLVHDSYVKTASFSSDGTRVVTASVDKTARVWDAATGKQLGETLHHSHGINCAAFSPDGKHVVTGSGSNNAQVWDTSSGRPVSGPIRHSLPVNAASFSPDGTRVVSASDDQTARVAEAATGQLLGESLRHGDRVTAASFSPDGTRVVTASADKTARVWDARIGRPLAKPLRHEKFIHAASFSPNGTRIVTASDDHTARVWDATTGQPVGDPLRHDLQVNAASFNADGTRVVTASADMTARIWDAATGKQLGGPLRHGDGVTVASFSPDGTRIVTASKDKTARVWDSKTGNPVGEPFRHEYEVADASFSPDGTRVVTGCFLRAQVWDAATGKPIGAHLPIKLGVPVGTFSPNGMHVLTASAERIARLWDATTGKLIGEPLRHELSISDASFSSDGTRVVTASVDKTARVWDATTCKPLGEPLRHEQRVGAASFSPDGTRVVTASGDSTARIWDAKTGKPLGAPIRDLAPMHNASFSPDGTRIVTVSRDTGRIWDVREAPQPSDINSWVELQLGGVVNEQGDFKPLSTVELEERMLRLYSDTDWLRAYRAYRESIIKNAREQLALYAAERKSSKADPVK